MSELQNNLQFTWHLVSQFVSWEFCRYMAEIKENPPETDVLVFLRNMIVERTEKAVSDITKHEIVAKLIMELKSTQSISRLSSIEPLGASVTTIFPKLKNAVIKLMDNLNNFLSALETIDEDRKEIIHVRIDETINDFITEANRLLSPPLLLQIVKPWKPKKKVYDHDIFENVLKCLCNDDPITRSEAKLIAISLKEDKVFERILLKLESNPESDSVPFSISHLSSQTSENIYSQEFIKNSQGTNKKLDEVLYLSDNDLEACKSKAGPSNLQPPNNLDTDSFNLDTCPPVPGVRSNVPNSLEFLSNFEPPPVLPTDSPTSDDPPEYPFIHRINPSEIDKDIYRLGGIRDSLSPLRNAASGLMDDHGGLRKSPNGPIEAPVNYGPNDVSNHVHFTQSSANKSPPDKLNSILDSTVSIKFKEIYENQRFHKVLSDSDTSDCEKTEVIRFLTPTLFKKGTKKKVNKVVYLSDTESNNSSIRSVVPNSQTTDPNWTLREFSCATKNSNKRKNNAPKKSVRPLDDHSSLADRCLTTFDDSSIFMPSTSAAFRKTNKKKKDRKKVVRQLEDSSSSGTSLPTVDDFCVPSTSAACATGTIAKKRRIQLVSSSPSVRDFVNPIRRPTPSPSNQTPPHRSTNTKSKRKHPATSTKTSRKRFKCQDCSNSYKTEIALRRHIFLKHTPTALGHDSDFEE